MNSDYEGLKKITYQDIISVIFILASVLNIIASDKEKEYLISKNTHDKEIANNIYIIVLLILIIIYIYFTKVNNQVYKNCCYKDKKTALIRLYGSVFFLTGGLCFLYYRINDRENIQSSVEL